MATTYHDPSYKPEGLLLCPELLSLLVNLTLHFQFNLAQLIIMRKLGSTGKNNNRPFLLLGATVLP
jgi:hypothetical protein